MTYLSVISRFARWVPACLWAVLLMPGCAITAPVTAWKPAGIDTAGMQRLAVMTFSGENGASVTAALTTRLWETEFYALVDQSDLAAVRVASASDSGDSARTADYIDAARRRDLDGIIVGDVIEYRCDDQVLTDTNIHVGTDHAENRRQGIEHDGVDVGVHHNQSIHREATVSIAFRLVDVKTGDVRATRKTVQSFQGDYSNGDASLPPKGEVLDRLTQQCVEEFSAMLAPHEVELRLQIARSHLFQRGQALVGRGNDFAKRGRWDEAMAAWNQALVANPANDAALFNLAVAHAAQHDYTRAEEYAIQAINVRHKDLYADGLDQIRRLQSDHEQSLLQRHQAESLIRSSASPHLTSR